MRVGFVWPIHCKNPMLAEILCSNSIAYKLRNFISYHCFYKIIPRWLRLFKMAKMIGWRYRVVEESERNLVVHVTARGAGAGERRLLLPGCRTGGAKFGRTLCLTEVADGRGSAAAAVEHCQLGVEALQHDLGRVFVLAGLILPFAGLQRTFKVHLRALFQILLGHPAKRLAEDDDA